MNLDVAPIVPFLAQQFELIGSTENDRAEQWSASARITSDSRGARLQTGESARGFTGGTS